MKDEDVREEEVRLKAIMLRSQVAYHKYLYYTKAQPILDDFAFDKLEKEYAEVCELVERVYPAMHRLYAFRPWVGVNQTPYGDPKTSSFSDQEPQPAC